MENAIDTTAKPVTILTGFLGSGKTTLLNAILKANKEVRYAIIENEVGEIGIDGDLIINENDSFTELNNGCICCSINVNFIETLRELTERTDWDELIIEATGVANPGGILTPFKKLPWMKKYFNSPHVICIADVRNIEQQLLISDTAGSQLAYGDSIYLNKTDLVSSKQLAEVETSIKKLNPMAVTHKGNNTAIPLEKLLEKPAIFRLPFQLNSIETSINDQHDSFDSVSLTFDVPFDRDKLMARLHTFILFQSENVYRFKSIVYDSNSENKLIIQSVMKNLVIEEGNPWDEKEEKRSSFVFIGKGLKKEGFERILKQCLLK